MPQTGPQKSVQIEYKIDFKMIICHLKFIFTVSCKDMKKMGQG